MDQAGALNYFDMIRIRKSPFQFPGMGIRASGLEIYQAS